MNDAACKLFGLKRQTPSENASTNVFVASIGDPDPERRTARRAWRFFIRKILHQFYIVPLVIEHEVVAGVATWSC
jgi:hypothetical protein